MRKPLIKLETLKLMHFTYCVPGEEKERSSFALGYDSEDIASQIGEEYPELADTNVIIDVGSSVPVDWILSRVERKGLDLRKSRMKKRQFLYGLKYAGDTYLLNEKDKKDLDRIINKVSKRI